jgi:hypothetical protein
MQLLTTPPLDLNDFVRRRPYADQASQLLHLS